MTLPYIALYYIAWHYSLAIRDMGRHWKNGNWFLFHYFSIGLLIKTLFSPWRRLTEEKTDKDSDAFSRFIINTMMRLLGFFMRLSIIFTGLFVIVFGNLLFLFLVLTWILLPALIFFLIVLAVDNTLTLLS